MSNIKEHIIGAVTVMNDELLILKAYHDGNPEYQPHMSQEDLIKELDL